MKSQRTVKQMAEVLLESIFSIMQDLTTPRQPVAPINMGSDIRCLISGLPHTVEAARLAQELLIKISVEEELRLKGVAMDEPVAPVATAPATPISRYGVVLTNSKYVVGDDVKHDMATLKSICRTYGFVNPMPEDFDFQKPEIDVKDGVEEMDRKVNYERIFSNNRGAFKRLMDVVCKDVLDIPSEKVWEVLLSDYPVEVIFDRRFWRFILPYFGEDREAINTWLSLVIDDAEIGLDKLLYYYQDLQIGLNISRLITNNQKVEWVQKLIMTLDAIRDSSELQQQIKQGFMITDEMLNLHNRNNEKK